MRFGKTLRTSIYPPWKDHYIEYSKLKKLLREEKAASSPSSATPDTKDVDADEWTEEDERVFAEELLGAQLEKVNNFQSSTYQNLRDRTSRCEAELEKVADNGKDSGEQKQGLISADARKKLLEDVQQQLDSITKETNELEKYSRINFTGFLKAVKKHDRKRGSNYKLRPALQVRLGTLPFNSEDYSPLLFRLSAMYSYVRENLSGDAPPHPPPPEIQVHPGVDTYTSQKFWVHPDNLMEVKTYILRRLPVLVYNPQSSKFAESSQNDPTITSIYFDDPEFSLYTQKVDRATDASSLRLRWFGQLRGDIEPEIMLEKKTIAGDESSEERFPIKNKYIMPFIKGEYKMEKTIQRMQDRKGSRSGVDKIDQYEKTVDDIQKLIQSKGLQPVLRANYARTAFQIPGDSRVRVSLDTNVALIREDALDEDRPCRDPEKWHRSDIDDAKMEYPFSAINKGEVVRFPYALLEIKTRDGARKKNDWVSELMNSHLVKEAPRFSKFVHGVATLFEDYVNSFPFWLSEVDKDIRKDPDEAFVEEQERKAKQAQDELAVGSFIGSKGSPAFNKAIGSPVGKAHHLASSPRSASQISHKSSSAKLPAKPRPEVVEEDSDEEEVPSHTEAVSKGLQSMFPMFTSKYGRSHQYGGVQLPPGVRHPGQLIKDSGPVRVEPKVWLANQRTFIKWQHICVLLASLSLALYNSAGKDNDIARSLAIVYTLIAVFAGVWGWSLYIYRSTLIRERSGKDLDSLWGPIIICISLVAALCLNFSLKVNT